MTEEQFAASDPIIGCWNLRNLAPEPFLALQTHIGSTCQGLEVRFALTRG
jgi:hypothetical protein